MRDLVFLLSADLDIQQAYEYYENYQEGRGDIFMRHLDTAFTHLRMFPLIAPIFHAGYRRLLVPRYPYGIFYFIESSRVIVVAVKHFQQDLEALRRQLS